MMRISNDTKQASIIELTAPSEDRVEVSGELKRYYQKKSNGPLIQKKSVPAVSAYHKIASRYNKAMD